MVPMVRALAKAFSVDLVYQTRGRPCLKIHKVAPHWPNDRFLYTSAPTAETLTMSTTAVVTLTKNLKIKSISTVRSLQPHMKAYRMT